MKTNTLLDGNKIGINRVLCGLSARLLGAILTLILLTAVGHAGDMGMKLAKDRSIMGKNKPGQCAIYADRLFTKMNDAGVVAYRVGYNWENLNARAGGEGGAHAIVVFRDERGRYYGVDNLTWKPVWLKGSSPSEWARSFSGLDASTSVRLTVASRAAINNADTAYASR